MREIFSASLIILALRALTLASRFLLSILLARMLAPADLGQFGLVTAYIAFCALMVGVEFYTFANREVVTADHADRVRMIFSQSALYAAAHGIGAILIMCASAMGWIPFHFAIWIVPILFFEHLTTEAARSLYSQSRFVEANVLYFIRGGIWVYVIGLVMLLVPSARTLQVALAGWLAGGILGFIYVALLVRRIPWKTAPVDWPWILSGFKITVPFIIGAASALTLSYVDRFFIERYAGLADLGVYTLFSSLTMGALSLGAAISETYRTKVVAAHGQGPSALRRSLREFLLFVAGSSAAAIVLLAVLIHPALAIVGRAEYSSNLSVYYVLLLGVTFRVLADVPAFTLYALRADMALLASNLLSAACAIAFNVLLTPRYGLIGAASASAAAAAVLLCVAGTMAFVRLRRLPKET